MPQISIIMPLYNAQKYLEESLTSVLSQTFTDYELICINDGSSDETKSIIQKYGAMDTRIRILENQTRSGAAYSRNKGIVEARGKYIIFLDGDDIFEEEMLEVTYACAEKNNTDILMFSYKHMPSSQIYNKVEMVHGDNYVQKYCKEVFSVKNGKPYELLLWATSPCNKLFKRKFIIDNKLLFQNLPSANDIYFVNMALMISERIMVLDDKRVMVYARDHDEPSRISAHRDPMCSYKVYEYLLRMLLDKEMLEVLYQHYFYQAFFSFKYALEQTKEKMEARCFYEFLRNEGIQTLRQLSRKYENKNNDYINYIFDKFKNNDFETRWFEEENVLKVYIRESRDKFSALFINSDVIVWGAGQNGKTILQMCKKLNLKVKYVVDTSEIKQGKYIEGYCILKPESVMYDADTILISAYGIFMDVKKVVCQYNSKVKIIDIADYLSID